MTTLFNACRPVKVSPAFGVGILAPTAKAAHRWASDEEYRAHYLGSTLSRDEYLALRSEAEAATRDRYSRAEQAECDEWGISPERMEELAEDSGMIDLACGIDSAAAQAVAEVRRVEIRGAAYVAETIAVQDDEIAAAVRLTGPAGRVYDVSFGRYGFACTCPDFVFKHEGKGSLCKHVVGCRAAGMLDAAAPAPAKVRKPRPLTIRQKRRAALKDAAALA